MSTRVCATTEEISKIANSYRSALHNSGASAGDKGAEGVSARPLAILFSMVIAHCSSLLIAFVLFRNSLSRFFQLLSTR